MLISSDLRIYLIESNLLTWILLFSMLLMVEIGWRLGHRLSSEVKVDNAASTDTFMAGIFGLLALLLALTFSGASDRFDKRRDFISKELSAIGTAYQSIDLLSAKSQTAVRNTFIKYLDTRITIYQGKKDESSINHQFQIHDEIGNELWRVTVLAVRETPYPEKLIAAQILPELSSMFDASANQRLAMKLHPPPIIWQALICLSLVGSLVAGYSLGLQKKRDWFLTLVFIVMMAGTIMVILNLEYPRLGFVKLDDFDIELVNLRKSF
jgi:cytochrome c oxidase subunit IV